MSCVMSWEEWASHDAVGLAEKVRKGEVSSTELAHQVAAGVALVNPSLSAVVEVFADVVRPLVDRVCAGVHATLVCLGGAQAGKTHALFGNGVQSGVIKRACEEVFERTRLPSASHRQFQVRLAMFDLHGEHVLDLLLPDPQRSLPIVDSRLLGAYVADLTEIAALATFVGFIAILA